MIMNHSVQCTFFCRSRFDAPTIGLFQLIEGYSVAGKHSNRVPATYSGGNHDEKPASRIINLFTKQNAIRAFHCRYWHTHPRDHLHPH